eukprot:CAMPEP_0195095820 /NCGR_PEP_ID=MMETSP0448-20130528/48849_1 /TAXON_ID=66468 /ORGANISM="Heterocapsa triquestra, Strain CCMP 448" /LENGTH=33 /DNA_ID= /DNA_START= /DNA_END= /DNA_ORIENTATION=
MARQHPRLLSVALAALAVVLCAQCFVPAPQADA